jgi:hypothetical protein
MFCSRSVGSIDSKLGPVKASSKTSQVDAVSFDEYILEQDQRTATAGDATSFVPRA